MGLFHTSKETPQIRAPWRRGDTQSPDMFHKSVKTYLKVPAASYILPRSKTGVQQRYIYQVNRIYNGYNMILLDPEPSLIC